MNNYLKVILLILTTLYIIPNNCADESKSSSTAISFTMFNNLIDSSIDLINKIGTNIPSTHKNIDLVDQVLKSISGFPNEAIMPMDPDNRMLTTHRILKDNLGANYKKLAVTNRYDFDKELIKYYEIIQKIIFNLEEKTNNVPYIELIAKKIKGLDMETIVNLNIAIKQSISREFIAQARAVNPVVLASEVATVVAQKLTPEELAALSSQKVEEEKVSAIKITDSEIERILGTKNTNPSFTFNEDTGEITYIYTQPYLNVNPQLTIVQPRESQKQKKELCATYSLVNAWALEELVKEGKEITADNLFGISEKKVAEIYEKATKSGEIIVGQIDINQVLDKTKFFIENETLRKKFTSHINVLGIIPNDATKYTSRIFAQKDRILPKELQNIFTGTQYFFNTSTQHPFIPSYVNTLKQYMYHNNQYIEHFICNTGGHWILISIFSKPGKPPHMYYVDSSGSPIDGEKKARMRYIFAIFKNFIDKPVF